MYQMSGVLYDLDVEGKDVFHPYITSRNIRDVWVLWLCIERNIEVSLLITNETIGSCRSLWVMSL